MRKADLPPDDMADMLIEWLRHGLEKPGKTNTALAAALGLPQSRVAEMKSGRRSIKTSELKVISDYIEEPVPPSILSNSLRRKVTVVGMVGAGAEIFSIDDHMKGAGLDEVDVPPNGASDTTVAVILRGDSMEPAYSNGDIVYYDRVETGDLANLNGRTCVVRLSDGRTFIKRLFKSNGTYVLQSHNAEPIVVASVEWAARVLWVKKA